MKKLLLLVAFLCTVLYSFSQSASPEIIATSGDYQKNQNGSISWTMGESVNETLESNDIILTQGFQQSKLTITTIKELQNISFDVSAFPNPVKDFITLKVESENLKKISYSLFDVNGKFLIKNKIISNETEIPFLSYSPSSYFLKIYYGKKEIKTFKIVKQKTK